MLRYGLVWYEVQYGTGGGDWGGRGGNSVGVR